MELRLKSRRSSIVLLGERMVAAPVPTVATLTFLELPGTPYKLRKLLVAEIETDAAGFVVSEQSTGVFSYDVDFSQALTGFFRAFADEFDFLRRNRERLSPSPLGELERFESLLENPGTITA